MTLRTGELADLERYAGLAEGRRLEGGVETLLGVSRFVLDAGPWAERLVDLLRSDTVASALRAVREGGGAAGRARLAMRALARPYLDRAGCEAASEIHERFRRGDWPDGGFETEIARCPDPERRSSLHEAWVRWEDTLRPALAAWRAARDGAAGAAGAAGTPVLLAADQSDDLEQDRVVFERTAIAPLDEAVAAARARIPVEGTPAGRELLPGDVPGLEAGTNREAWPGREAIPPILGAVARALGEDPNGRGPVVRSEGPPGPRARFSLPADARPVVAPGCFGGPRALGEALEATGRAIRAGFLARERGTAAARWSDPAFDHAAGVLLRRLVLDDGFLREFGLAASASAAAELRLAESLAPRRAWAYLSLAAVEPDAALVLAEETMRRTAGRPATPDVRLAAVGGDPWGLAALRGTVLAILVEEELLTRYGRRWTGSAAARSRLRELWEVEPDETPERMAAALGLDTMDGTPIADRCRP